MKNIKRVNEVKNKTIWKASIERRILINMDDKISRDDLEKYSREQLENIIINTCAVIDRFDIRAVYDNFSFRMEGKQYDAKTLVDMWNLSDRKCACDICDYRINNEKAEG